MCTMCRTSRLVYVSSRWAGLSVELAGCFLKAPNRLDFVRGRLASLYMCLDGSLFYSRTDRLVYLCGRNSILCIELAGWSM